METLLELPELWQSLQKENRPIVLYGTGDGAEKIRAVCQQKGIPIQGVFASDSFVRTKEFYGLPVVPLADLEQNLGELVVLLAFGTARPEVLEHIVNISRRHTLYAPDVPVAGETLFTGEFFSTQFDRFVETFHMLQDDLSRQVYKEVLSYKLTGNPEFLWNHGVSRKEMFRELFVFQEQEVFVDAGAFRGDTIEEFLAATGGVYHRIFGLEPDGKNFLRLKKNLEVYPRVSLVNGAAWNREELLYFQPRSGRSGRVESGSPNTRGISIDDLVGESRPTYLKYDVEGAEAQALEGSKKVISCYAPKLLVSVYHRSEDLITLPQQIQTYQPNYKYYLRRNFGVPAWDLNLICIPKGEKSI